MWLMAKYKKQQLVPSEKKHISSSGKTFSGEDDWVIVKKQRITILIPPRLHSRKPTATHDDPWANTREDISITTKNNKKQLQLSNPTDEPKHVVDGKVDGNSPGPETSSQFPNKVPTKILNIGIGKVPSLHVKRIPYVRETFVEVQDTGRPLNRPRRLLIGATASIDVGVFLNQMIRASNLHKKIHRAGGVSNWLASLGLHQFVSLFNKRKVDKFQLVNLTMKKLRVMGVIAVRARGKLMHALACLCQPYGFLPSYHNYAASLNLVFSLLFALF